MGILLLALIVVPLVEIAVFIQVGQAIGLGWTLFGVVATAIAGAFFLRQQGLKTLRNAQATLARQEMPVREVFDGLCLFFTGALLLTPGFVTDTIGFLLLVPAVRGAVAGALMRYLARRGELHVHTGAWPGGPQGRKPNGRGDVIDADYREVDPETEEEEERADLPPPDRSRWGRRERDE